MKSIILLALVLATACSDDGVDSYAYITKVHAYSQHAGTRHDHYCTVVAKLPHGVLTTQPTDGDTSLVGNAMTITADISDDSDKCNDYLHRWMHVTFAPDDRTKVDFDPPDPGITWQRIVGLGLVVVLIPAYARDKLRARRQRRR